jgi:diamine N-acetyltransferase
MSCKLRPTTERDLSFVIEIEHEAAKAGVVTPQSRQEHDTYLKNADIRHLIIENGKKAVGYAILAGLLDKNETIELRRIVVAEKGKGYGRKTLRLIKKMAFEEFGAHRLWLDVADFNERARRLYESEGFVEEGVWRECFKAENGQRESLIFMSILRREYFAES